MNRAANRIEVFGLGQCTVDRLGVVDAYPAPDEKVQFSDMVVQCGGPVATALKNFPSLFRPGLLTETSPVPSRTSPICPSRASSSGQEHRETALGSGTAVGACSSKVNAN